MSNTELRERLQRRIAAAVGDHPSPDTVILAGHFAVFTAGGRAGDLLDDATPVAGHTDMVDFTRSSWLAACDAIVSADALGTGAARLVVLADDIQFVRPALPDRGARERLAAALAADYLRRTQTLPGFHLRELDARGIDMSRIVRRRDDAWIFSERALREESVDRIRAAARAGLTTHTTSLSASADASRIVVRDTELGEHTLVHSGHTSCAGGYLELVMQLHARGVRRLVAVVPRRCLGPVTLGTALAKSLFGAAGIDVVNIPAGADGTDSAPELLRIA